MPEPKQKEMRALANLYMAKNFDELLTIAKESREKDVKNINRLPVIAARMLTEIRENYGDQEKVFVIGKRYIRVMEHYLDQSGDKKQLELRHGNEMHLVEGMLDGLSNELRMRYTREVPQGRKMGSSNDSEKNYITSNQGKDVLPKMVFSDTEIPPVELFNAMMQGRNILIVDIRPSEEFAESRINMQNGGSVINIPQDIIVPGLSANTLGLQLNEITREIWNRRETYEGIVLMDWETDSTNFVGSKLERLRNIILEWDLNRKYHQPPVILSGGYKEFAEWYPSEVTNSLAYVSQTNSDMDDLLTIDDIDYPELGSGGAKKLNASNFGDVHARVARDFGDLDVIPARASKSEGELPRDYFSSNLGRSPFRSISEESLPRDYYAVESLHPIPVVDLPQDLDELESLPEQDMQQGPSTSSDTAMSITEETAVLRNVIDEDMADMLKKARASKPPRRSPSPRERNLQDLFNPPQRNDGDSTFRPARPARPPVNRSFKPVSPAPRIAQGYTGIRNHRNNCYVSSIMQALKVLPPLKSLFVTSDRYLNHVSKDPPCLILHFATVLKILWEGTQRHPRSYYPGKFLERIYELNQAYAQGDHEDAFEFFIFLFNNISDDCSYDLPRPKIMTDSQRSWFSQLQGRSSFLIDMMYYQLKNSRTCWRCQKPSFIFDQDSTLMLSIPEDPRLCNLPYLLADFLKENLVSDFSCAACKSSSTIVNRKEIVQDPEVLVIVLKRYAVNSEGVVSKDETPVFFPEHGLEFSRSVYRLYSVVHHTGAITHGHYYTSAMIDDDKEIWCVFNDTHITRYTEPITETHGIQSSSVGFFYVKQDKKPESIAKM